MAVPLFPALCLLQGESWEGSAANGRFRLPESLGSWGGKETSNCRMPVLSLQMFLMNLCGDGCDYSHFMGHDTGTQATQLVSSRAGM